MKARTHDLAAITGLVVTTAAMQPSLPTFSLSTVIVALIANQLGGIAPDIDQPTAPFWRNLPIGGIFGRMIGKMLGGHRFITHSLVGVVLAGFLLNLLLGVLQPIMPGVQTEYIWWAFMIGMISHLIMDSFTKEGVPWLLPIPVKFGFPPLKRFRITTGKWVENFVVFPLLIVGVLVISGLYYQQLLALIHGNVVQ
jgi:inner membrane protein